MSHCLLSSYSNRGKPEMTSTCCAATTCSQHLVTQPDSSDILYVYSAEGNPASNSAYSFSVAPIVLSGESVLNVNGVSWLEIQHLQIDWFDAYGVQVQGASDHLWLANIAANSEVENSTVPLG